MQQPIQKDTLGRLAAHRRTQVELRFAGSVAYVDNDVVFAGEGGQPLDEHLVLR